VGLFTLRLRQKSPQESTSRVNFNTPYLVIFIAISATGAMVLVSVVRHPVSGFGFLLFCAVSACIYTYVIRAYVTAAYKGR
jgi:hypothetical protein